jgi:hypothetical protein
MGKQTMTVRLANEIREASKPIHCAACFNSQDIRHVDFDAACDRGYSDGVAVAVSMDELVLCENCVRVGAELLGMTNSEGLKAQLEDAKRKNDVLRRRLEQQQRYADTLEEGLVRLREKPVRIDHRQKPRQLRDEVQA